jgi:hypothetical protein
MIPEAHMWNKPVAKWHKLSKARWRSPEAGDGGGGQFTERNSTKARAHGASGWQHHVYARMICGG